MVFARFFAVFTQKIAKKIAKITKILEGTLDPKYPVIIAVSGGPLFFPASEKNLGLKPVFFPGGICRRLRRGAAIRFRQKPKLALSINGEIASKMVKSRRPEDLPTARRGRGSMH